MKKIFCLMMALALIAGAFSFASAQKMYTFCSPKSSVNIRKSPNPHSKIIGHLYFGYDVDILGMTKVNGVLWYKIEAFVQESDTGWVSSEYFTSDKPVETNDIYIVTVKKVHTRVSIGGKVKRTLKKGTKLQAYAVSDEWVLTSAGYLKTEFAERMNE